MPRPYSDFTRGYDTDDNGTVLNPGQYYRDRDDGTPILPYVRSREDNVLRENHPFFRDIPENPANSGRRVTHSVMYVTTIERARFWASIDDDYEPNLASVDLSYEEATTDGVHNIHYYNDTSGIKWIRFSDYLLADSRVSMSELDSSKLCLGDRYTSGKYFFVSSELRHGPLAALINGTRVGSSSKRCLIVNQVGPLLSFHEAYRNDDGVVFRSDILGDTDLVSEYRGELYRTSDMFYLENYNNPTPLSRLDNEPYQKHAVVNSLVRVINPFDSDGYLRPMFNDDTLVYEDEERRLVYPLKKYYLICLFDRARSRGRQLRGELRLKRSQRGTSFSQVHTVWSDSSFKLKFTSPEALQACYEYFSTRSVGWFDEAVVETTSSNRDAPITYEIRRVPSPRRLRTSDSGRAEDSNRPRPTGERGSRGPEGPELIYRWDDNVVFFTEGFRDAGPKDPDYDPEQNKIKERGKRNYPFLGVELEVETVIGSKTEALAMVEEVMPPNFYIPVGDGSLSSKGFEMVSTPATLSFHKKTWKPFFKVARSRLRSWNTSTCGIHVHISRAGFSSKEAIKSFVYMINSVYNRRLIQDIAGRPVTKESLSSRTRYQFGDPSISKDTPLDNPDKYVAVNLAHRDTLEVRIFKGTVNVNGFFKNLEFTHALCKFCNEHLNTKKKKEDDAAFYYEHFLEWLKGENRVKQYHYLHKFLRAKGYYDGDGEVVIGDDSKVRELFDKTLHRGNKNEIEKQRLIVEDLRNQINDQQNRRRRFSVGFFIDEFSKRFCRTEGIPYNRIYDGETLVDTKKYYKDMHSYFKTYVENFIPPEYQKDYTSIKFINGSSLLRFAAFDEGYRNPPAYQNIVMFPNDTTVYVFVRVPSRANVSHEEAYRNRQQELERLMIRRDAEKKKLRRLEGGGSGVFEKLNSISYERFSFKPADPKCPLQSEEETETDIEKDIAECA